MSAIAVGSGADARFSERALAKINLTLRVLGRRQDGYHLLESIVAFADLGERVDGDLAGQASLAIKGPQAAGLDGHDNLVLRADAAFRTIVPGAPRLSYCLVKHIPLAAGLGGGSADAAAVLRILARASHRPIDDPEIATLAATVGADVPVCLLSRAALMTGIGETADVLPHLPSFAAVLVNPGIAVSTADVFAALGLERGETVRRVHATPPIDSDEMLERAIVAGINSLEAPAIGLFPEIGEVVAAIRGSAGCRVARMSGSGATCFGLYGDVAQAEYAALELMDASPDWWVRSVTLT